MVHVKLNPDLTEDQIPQVVAELEKLSSLKRVEAKLETAGKPVEPLPSKELPGSHPRDNNVFIKDYVDGALELAQMLGIENQGTVNPSKGLSFRAKNYKFYDFMDYWSALVKRFSLNEERMSVFENDTKSIEDRMNVVEQDNKSTTFMARNLYDYVEASRKLLDRKVETIQAQTKDYEAAALLIAEHVGDFATKADQLDKFDVTLAKELLSTKIQINKHKKQLFWLAVLTAFPAFYFYGSLLVKLF